MHRAAIGSYDRDIPKMVPAALELIACEMRGMPLSHESKRRGMTVISGESRTS